MSDEPTQPTQPRKREGDKWVTNPDVEPVDIPVPKRGQVERDFERAIQPVPAKPKRARRRPSRRSK